jgi:hypothetical protein
MLNVPSVSEMLSVIAVALLATAVLVGLFGVLLTRVRATAKPMAPAAPVPAQRSSSNRPTPVSTH